MKKIHKNIITLILATVALMGCEDVAIKVKMPPAEKKIVVQSFISPDDPKTIVMVSWSKPVIGTSVSAKPEYITDALVEISNGSKIGKMNYETSYNVYYINADSFPIEAGKKYFLSVTLPDGKRVKANCDVPLAKNTSLVFTSRDSSEDKFSGKTMICNFNYTDQDGAVNNYYRLDGKAMDANQFQDIVVTGDFKKDDELKANNQYQFFFYNDQMQPVHQVKAWLINCDYNYFQYHKTLQGAQNNMGFFSEPSIVYSNIEGGLGCFGAYNSYELEVNF